MIGNKTRIIFWGINTVFYIKKIYIKLRVGTITEYSFFAVDTDRRVLELFCDRFKNIGSIIDFCLK